MRAAFRSATTRLILAHFLLVAISTALVLGYVRWTTSALIEQEVRQVVQAEIAEDGTVLRPPIYRNTSVPKIVRPRVTLSRKTMRSATLSGWW